MEHLIRYSSDSDASSSDGELRGRKNVRPSPFAPPAAQPRRKRVRTVNRGGECEGSQQEQGVDEVSSRCMGGGCPRRWRGPPFHRPSPPRTRRPPATPSQLSLRLDTLPVPSGEQLEKGKELGDYLSLVFVPFRPPEAVARDLAAALSGLPTTAPLTPLLDGDGLPGAGAGGGAGELHMSLSRSARLKFAQIKDVLTDLREACARLRPFEVTLSGAVALPSGDRTKTFVAATVEGPGRGEAEALLRAVDGAMALHGLPSPHRDALPHVSLGWCPGDHVRALRGALGPVEGALAGGAWTETVRDAVLLAGEKRFPISIGPLSLRRRAAGGARGPRGGGPS